MKKQKAKSAREIKEEKVEALTEKFKTAKTITFADYRGLTANQIAALRDKVRATDAQMVVEKNNLLKIALKNAGFEITKENDPQSSLLTGPTIVVVAQQDEIAPIKEIAKSSTEFGLPTFKFGFFQKDFLTAASVEKLSKIPGREVLQAKLVGSLASPLYGIASVLSANIRNLVFALDQIKIKKEVK